MAVAHDAASESHAGTTGSTSQASFGWTHTPVGTPAGILVFVWTNANADYITSVDWGGVTLTQFSEAIDTATEPGRMTAFFHGGTSELAARSGNTVTVTRTNNTTTMYASAVTVTAQSTYNTYTGTPVLLQEDGTLAEQSVTDGSPGTNSVRYAAIYSGLAAPPAAGASSTLLTSIDIGNNGAAMVRETTAGQGARNVGFSSGTSDDRAAIHVAISERPSLYAQALTASLSFSGANAQLRKKFQSLSSTLSFSPIASRSRKASGRIYYAHGFESNDTEVWNSATSGGTVATSTTQAKSGTYSIRINRTSTTVQCAYYTRSSTEDYGKPPAPRQTGRAAMSFWVYFATLPTANTTVATYADYTATNPRLDIKVDSSGNVTGSWNRSGGTSTTTTLATITSGTWNQIELATDWNSTSTNAAKCNLRVNGGTAQELTSTIGSLPDILVPTFGTYYSETSGTYDMYVDDIVWTDGYALPGRLVLRSLNVDGDADSNWTPSTGTTRWQRLTYPWSSSDYISSSTANQQQNLTLGTSTVTGTLKAFVARTRVFSGGGSGDNRGYQLSLTDSSGNLHGDEAFGSTGNGGSHISHTLSVNEKYNGGSLDQAYLDGLRLRVTHDSSTNPARVTDAVTYAVIEPIYRQTLTATLSFSGAITRKVKAIKSATLGFTGATTKKVKAVKAGTLSFTSAQTRKGKKIIGAVLDFAGAVATNVIVSGSTVPKALTATLSFTSAQAKKVKAVKAGTLSFTSAQTRKGKKSLTASWSGTGTVTSRIAVRKSLSGALTFTSAQTRKVRKTVSGTLSYNGAITRRVRVAYAAAGSFTGSLTKRVRKTLTATLGFSGSNTQAPQVTSPSTFAGPGWWKMWRRRREFS